jgi:hypothetical protein
MLNITINHNFAPNHMGTESETNAWLESLKQDLSQRLTPYIESDRIPSFEHCTLNMYSNADYCIYTIDIYLEHDEDQICSANQWPALKQDLLKELDGFADDSLLENRYVTLCGTKCGIGDYRYHLYINAIQRF